MNPMQEYYNAIIGSYIRDGSLPVASPAGASHKPDLDYGLKSESSFSYRAQRAFFYGRTAFRCTRLHFICLPIITS